MEISSVTSPRNKSRFIDDVASDVSYLQTSENGDKDLCEIQFHSIGALGILRETVGILRYNSLGFVVITLLLISPVSTVFLSDILVHRRFVETMATKLLVVAKSSIGLPLGPFVKHSCQRISNMALSALMCFPLYITLLLVSKAAISHSVHYFYQRKNFSFSSHFFSTVIIPIWRRLAMTYLLSCAIILACLSFLPLLLILLCNILSFIGFPLEAIVYPAILILAILLVFFCHAFMICSVAIVSSILEDNCGAGALIRSRGLMKGKMQVSVLLCVGSRIGLQFVEGLFEYRVKKLSYGDGSSRMWEGPLLVMMYSFGLLVESMMTSVFFISCRSAYMETFESESSTGILP